MIKLLTDLESHLSKIEAPVLQYFRPPIESEKILIDFVQENYSGDYRISNELISIYLWHNGTNIDEDEIEKSYFAHWLTLNDLDTVRNIISNDNFYNFIPNKLFPFCSSLNGEFLAIDFMHNTQKLIYCSTWDMEIESQVSMFDSPRRFLETINQFYEKDIYVISEGLIKLDTNRYQEYLEIGEKYNPESEYWKVKKEWQQ